MRRSSSGIESIEGANAGKLKSPAEGYFFIVSPPGPFSINQSIMSNMPFDPARDIAPVAMLGAALCASSAQPGKGVAVPK